jgi:hypothetical protein
LIWDLVVEMITSDGRIGRDRVDVSSRSIGEWTYVEELYLFPHTLRSPVGLTFFKDYIT